MAIPTLRPTEISVTINGVINYVPKSFWQSNFTDDTIKNMDNDAKPDHRIFYKFPDLPQFDQEWHELPKGQHLELFNGMKIVTRK